MPVQQIEAGVPVSAAPNPPPAPPVPERRQAYPEPPALSGEERRRRRKRHELDQFGVERRVRDLTLRYGLIVCIVVVMALSFGAR